MLKLKNVLKIYFLFFLPISFFGQLGPGGVGNTDGLSSLVLWTNPDDILEGDNASFSSWIDLSGYSSNLSQSNVSLQPIIKKDSEDVNGFPFVRFQATDRRLVKTNFTNFPTTAISGFYVNKTGDNNDGVLSYASTASNNNFLIFRSGNLRMYRNNPRTFNLAVNTGNWNVVGFGWTSAGGASRISLNGLNGTSVSANQNGVPITAGGDFSLAGEQDGSSSPYSFDPGQAHQGDFSEVILFNTYINEAKRIIVSNYLSAKYNINYAAGAIVNTDFYLQDDNGNFDFNVAGIGQAIDGSNHIDSQGTGIVRINTPSALSNDDYLFWGEDVKNAGYTFSSSASTNYIERLDTKWRVSKRNNLGTVTLQVKETDINFNSPEGCNELKLIVSNSSNFATKTTYDFVLSGGVYAATGVNFSDNDYFTLEYLDTIVLDNTQFYNGSGISNVPDITNGCYKLLVKNNSNGSIKLTEDAYVREIEIETGGILSTSSGLKLQVTNGIINNGSLRLVGGSQLIQTHNSAVNLNSGSGNLHVDQSASTSTIYQSGYWSSPVSNSGSPIGTPYSISSVLKDGTVETANLPTLGEAVDINFISGHDGGNATTPIEISTRWLAKFNNASDWTRFVSPTASIFNPGEGWNMKSVGSKFTFLGTPNDGDYSFVIDQDKFSLIGNPYPSALDANAFITDNSLGFNGILYIYDSASDNTHVRGDYTGTYSTIVSGVSVGTSLYLPIGQAFFVTREAAGSGTITFSNSQRIMANISETGSLVAKNVEKEKQDESLSLLKLGFQFNLTEKEKRTRTVAISFRGLSDKYDKGYDAEMWGLQPTDLYLKVADLEKPFIITGVELFNNSIKIPLVVQIDKEREVVFSVEEKNNINTSVYLFDAVLNTYYNLDEASKALNLFSGQYTDRFFITFSNKTLGMVTDDNFDSEIDIFKNKEKILTIRNKANLYIKTIKLYNLQGVEVLNYSINDKILEKNIDITNIAKSVYIFSIATEKGIVNQKIILD